MVKSTKSSILQGETGLREAPKGKDGARKFFPACRAGWRRGKTKLYKVGEGRGRGEEPIL